MATLAMIRVTSSHSCLELRIGKLLAGECVIIRNEMALFAR